MAPNKVGLHDVNGNYMSGEQQRIVDTGVSHVLSLHHHRDRWKQFNAWNIEVHARFDFRGSLSDPRGDAQTVANDLGDGSWQHLETLRVRNEPNLESPGATPNDWYIYLRDFGREFRSLFPSLPLYVPAISPSGADISSWLSASVDGANAGGFQGLDVHAYGTPEQIRQWFQTVRTRYSGKIIVSETNPGAGQQFSVGKWAEDVPKVIAACPGALAVIFYIARWVNPDMSLPTSVDILGTPVEEAIKRATSGVIPMPPGGGTVPVTDVDKAAILKHLDFLWGYTNTIDLVGIPAKSATLLEATKAYRERILAIKAIVNK